MEFVTLLLCDTAVGRSSCLLSRSVFSGVQVTSSCVSLPIRSRYRPVEYRKYASIIKRAVIKPENVVES